MQSNFERTAMFRRLFILIFLSITTSCFAGDYICHNEGKITKRLRSIDGNNLGPECLKVSRKKFNSSFGAYKVSPDGEGGNDDKIIPITEEELASEAALKEVERKAAECVRLDQLDLSSFEILQILIDLEILVASEVRASIKAGKGCE